MKFTTWANLREYIDLTIKIRDMESHSRLGGGPSRGLERLRLLHSELETKIREACDDWENKP
jgi:hypothetical protein